MLFPLGDGDRQLKNRIFSVQECVIRDFADRESCIVVGRCADYILRDYPNLMGRSTSLKARMASGTPDLRVL